MIASNSFPLNAWLETHESPFVVIDKDLRIVAVNSAWEKFYGFSAQKIQNKPCCTNNSHCRHQQFFESGQAYAGFFNEGVPVGYDQTEFWVSGYAIKNTSGDLFLGESMAQTKSGRQSADKKSPYFDAHSNQKLGQLEKNAQNLIGISPAFLKLQAKLHQVATTNVPVLLLGETGTGKEIAASIIHTHSNLAKKDFIVVDCTLLTENLFESELFGHEKGAFTNAISSKKGLFELANNGTLFLDEIGELPLSQQPKLLRALESGQFRRVGGSKTLTSNVRLICATHRDLAAMVKNGEFREDLYYRLSVLTVEIPPLRERKQDLPLLAEHLLRLENHIHSLSQAAINKLLQHSWPGNIRELKNCLQLASAMAGNKQIDKQDIHILRRRSRTHDIQIIDYNTADEAQTDPATIENTEKERIATLLKKFQGNRKQIAAELNISERTLYRKLNRFELS